MVNKAQLIDKLASSTGLSKSVATVAFNSVFSTITKSLAAGQSVSIASFGKFEVKKRVARAGVSPRDPKQRISIPAVKVARFRAGKGLKQAVR
ncbi:HU family DNA-binding protein [Candidatus Microgenomates bacterium]|nr:HU family DNA-binding protein [Candidatus Microgenomates bacterium]